MTAEGLPVPPVPDYHLTRYSYLNHGLSVWAIIGPMSYSITVVAKGGQLTVRHSGEVPDGEHVISGHEDATSRTLHVARFTPESKAVARASSEHHREQ